MFNLDISGICRFQDQDPAVWFAVAGLRSLGCYIELKGAVSIMIFAGEHGSSRSGRGVETEIKGEGGEENGDGIGIRLYRGEEAMWPG